MAFLAEQSEALRNKVVASEKALQDFRDREQILNVKGVSLAGASRQLEELTASLVEARRKRADVEAALNQVRAAQKGGSGRVDTLPAVLRHPLVQRAKERESEAERNVEDASKRYGPEHRRMIAARADVRAAKDNLRRQVDIVVASLAKEYEGARANEVAIARAFERAKADIQSFNRKEFELTSLEREVAANRQLYELFIQRSKETNVSDELQGTIARVIDPAVVPMVASGPDKRRIVMVSVLIALIIAMALAVFLERLDNTVKTSHDVESRLDVPAVGVVLKTKLKRDQSIERLFLEDPGTAFSEAIRTTSQRCAALGSRQPAEDSARDLVDSRGRQDDDRGQSRICALACEKDPADRCRHAPTPDRQGVGGSRRSSWSFEPRHGRRGARAELLHGGGFGASRAALGPRAGESIGTAVVAPVFRRARGDSRNCSR